MSRRNIGHDAHQLLMRAFDNGAFIAGGCASAMLRHGLTDDDDACERFLFDYLLARPMYNAPTQQVLDDKDAIPIWRVGGDIDLFFPDENEAQRFIYESKLAHPDVPNAILRSGAAHEFVMSKSVVLQVNLRSFGTMEQVISTFDITNAMVATSQTRSIVENNVIDLIRKSELDLAVFPMTSTSLWRLGKWARKQKYKKLTQGTGEEASRYFIENFASSDALQRDDHKGMRKLINNMNTFAKSLSDEALLMLLSTPISGFDTNDGYGPLKNARDEFLQRGRALDGAGE